MLFTEEGTGGAPFRISVGSCRPVMKSRLRLMGSLLRTLAPERALGKEAARIHYEPTGRPVLEIAGEDGPFVSFSRSGERVWAALSRDGPVGVDAAASSEFRPPYPFRRVFSPGEWTEAARICSSPEDVAPLLWTLKEAAVKALGRGFGDLDPLDVENIGLSLARGIVRGRIRAGEELSGVAFRHADNLWIGIAWLGKEMEI